MSKTFKSTATGRTLRISGDAAGMNVTINNVTGLVGVISLTPTDAPALALAALEAAGWPEEAKTSITRTILKDLQFVIECIGLAAKEAADREVLEKRRDEVAKELGGDTISYKMCNRAFQNAIDRIIELEAKS